MKKVIFRFSVLVFPLCLIFFESQAIAKTLEDKTSVVSTVSSVDLDQLSRSSISDTVTVISSRLPSFRTPLSNIPANVTYKSRQDIGNSKPQMFQDALRDTEGAVFQDSVGNGYDKTFSMRGFADGSSVIFLVDGVRVNEVDGDAMNYPLLPIDDLESIQIERGSQSPVYGSGAFGGVVNVATRKPSDKMVELFGGTEWSSFSGIRFHNGVSGTIPDKLLIDGGQATYYFNMGRALNQGFRNNGEIRITSLNTKVGYELPDDGGSINVGFKHVDDAVSLPGELTLDQFQNDPHATNKPLDGRDFKNSIIQFSAEKKFWDNRISSSVLAYWRTNWIHFFSTFATFATTFPNQLTTIRSRSTDLIWQNVYEDHWDWLGNRAEVGIEFEDLAEHATRRNVNAGGNVVETTAVATDRSAAPFNTAIFWRETVDVSQRVFLHFGMRHDFSWAEIEDNLTPTNNYTRRWRDSTLSTGLVVKPIQWIDVFTNYSQGFRVPAISEINSFNSDLNATLEPEKSDSYEIGTRMRYQELAEVKTSLFLIEVKDEIVRDNTQRTAANPFGRNVNAGKTRRYGVENRLEIKPVEEFSGYGSHTFMKAYISEAPLSGTPFNDRELGQIPQHRFTAGFTVIPLKRLGGPYDGLKIKMDGEFVGQKHTEAFESTSEALISTVGSIIKPYTVWDLMILFEWKQQQIYFKINNLFGEKYFSRARASSSSGGIYPSGNYLFVNPGAPREYLVGMTWEFGA